MQLNPLTRPPGPRAQETAGAAPGSAGAAGGSEAAVFAAMFAL
ncbi:MAG: hypothetical protein K0R39_929, partial [Symbiobacteriaceae bacterium]|nr:hypothetical protein [Symbiobacteriaceae bacterium]